MKARLAILIAGIVAAVMIGASACATSRSETTSTQQGKAAAQQAGAAALPDTRSELVFKAAQEGNLVQIKSLLEGGARPDYTNASGVTPLMIAAGSGNTSIARALLDHRADANAKTPGGYTPLMAAALNGQKEMVELLISHGADPGAKDVSGRTAGGYAQDQQHSDIAGLLSKAGSK
jgi:ankyrin repeat protein